MSVGEWHEINGVRFRETLHGPMRWGTCVDCGGLTAVPAVPYGNLLGWRP